MDSEDSTSFFAEKISGHKRDVAIKEVQGGVSLCHGIGWV